MALTDTLNRDNAPLETPDARAEHVRQALAARPPGGWELALGNRLIKSWFKPSVFGAEQIPERPCLFVGNHGLFAIDGIILTNIMLHDHNRFLRPMGDKFLFTQPQVARYLLRRGATMGHPEVCTALMENGQDLLVFPGGAHEAVKKECENYRLQWKERYGFVRLAAQHGYTIMPFGMVGPDDFYQHLLEGEDIPDSALGQLLKRLGVLAEDTRSDLIPPLARGALGTALPRPHPCYIGFGKPLDLSALRGRRVARAKLHTLREDVASRIDQQIADMLVVRDQEGSEQGLLRRLLNL